MRNNYIKPYVHEIEPVYIPGLDCFENAILTITEWEFGECHKAYMHSWGFAYDRGNSSKVGGRLFANNYGIIGNVQKRYGISMEQYQETDEDKVINKIYSEISQNKPVIVYTDEYYCHWTFNYEKSHSPHLYMIVGFNENNDFICIDTLPKKKNIIVTKKQLVEGSSCIYSYEMHPVRLENRMLQDIIQDCMMSDIENNYRLHIDDMDLFIEDFKNIDYNTELVHDAIWYSPIFSAISRVYGGRIQFVEFLKDYQVHEDICEYINQLDIIANDWNVIRSLIMKLHFNNNDSTIIHNSMVDRISKVLELEKGLFQLLMSHLKEKRLYKHIVSKHQVDHVMVKEETSFYYVEIDSFFDNKSLYFDEESYMFEKKLESGYIWNIGNMSFDFNHREQLDNMTCQGQTIPLNGQAYTRLMLLGYAGWGDQIENLTIIYDDGSSDIIEIMFTDWWKDPEFGETIAWQSDGINLTDNSPYNGKIFAKSYRLHKSKNMMKVIFPNCEKLHIFAMTFAS